MALIIGEIEWGRPRLSDGGYLLSSSFKAGSGRAAACLNHWRDNDRQLRHAAYWGATESGLMVAHLLDEGDAFERAIVERVRRGELLFSHGIPTNPGDTRAAIKAQEGRAAIRPPEYLVRPLTHERIGHLSYVDRANFEQRPLIILDDAIRALSQDVARIAQGVT